MHLQEVVPETKTRFDRKLIEERGSMTWMEMDREGPNPADAIVPQPGVPHLREVRKGFNGRAARFIMIATAEYPRNPSVVSTRPVSSRTTVNCLQS